MADKNKRTKALRATSATIIFVAYFIAQIPCWFLLESKSSTSLLWLGDILGPIIGCLVMVLLAIILIPSDLKDVGPNGAAWILGHWENLIKGLAIGCIIGVCSLLWLKLNDLHLSRGGFLIEPIDRMVVTPGYQQMLAFTALVLLGPVVEEMMFRGILYGGYRKSFGHVWAVLITTGIFAAIHFPYYLHVPYKIVPYIVSPLALLWCRLHWKAIGPAIAAHSGINIVVVVIPSIIFTWQHAFYESGVADYKASNFNQAIASLTHAIQLGDNSSNVYVYRGNAKLEKGDIDGAISDYSKAIELDPKDSKAFFNRGFAKRRNADLEGAIADFDEAIALNPGYIKAYNDRGLAKVSEGKLEAAVADFNMAVELNPTNAMYYDNRGWTKFLEGDFSSSITDATRSIELDPNVGYAYGTRGWARYSAGDIPGAVEDCNRATQLFKSGSAPFFHDQGLVDFIAQDYKKATTDWETAIEQEPDLKKDLKPWIEKAQSIKTNSIPHK